MNCAIVAIVPPNFDSVKLFQGLKQLCSENFLLPAFEAKMSGNRDSFISAMDYADNKNLINNEQQRAWERIKNIAHANAVSSRTPHRQHHQRSPQLISTLT